MKFFSHFESLNFKYSKFNFLGDEKQTVDEIEENFLKYTKQILTKVF